ncbi:ornithine cyclodeaminase family protein [Limobrevibacterium gyesilva]|uniref:Ornithine cyclodeaminase family protein n=1 Tax=Limobrevibacterium gyesilva TaxID=2991712 RepID=A0AA42CGZ0_9PROT|nr:ornithine cyclodeaminase family protein [Limobrevibacterium gyesilva]MCW3474452.1 ornithine cyclodeaminase family protein [Limobrevibacterium gyesilva]
MRILTRADITALVDVAALIAPVAAAMQRVSEGRAELPLRSVVPVGGGNRLGVMPGALGDPPVYGAKLLSLFPDNPKHGRSSHAGLMLIFDPETGLVRACMDASELTALRTAAASAVATQALARADAATLAIIGCGEQAHSHLAAMRAVRPLRRVVVWGRDPANAEAFARRHGIDTADTLAAAVAQADIVCTVTAARTPLLQPDMLHAGLHVNAVGASVPVMQEIATGCVPAVDLFTDYKPSLEAQAAEVIDARRQGLIGPDHRITEIGDVLRGAEPGRRDAAAITLYRSLGVAAQDLAAAQFVLARAEQAQRGIVVEMA